MNLFNLDLTPHHTFSYQTVEAIQADINYQEAMFARMSRNWVANPRCERLTALYERQKQLLLDMLREIEKLNKRMYS